jgi:hypothetical protein
MKTDGDDRRTRLEMTSITDVSAITLSEDITKNETGFHW